MDPEMKQFHSRTAASQQAACKIFGGGSEMPYYHGGGPKYQDFSSAWTPSSEDFMGWPTPFGVGDGDTTDPASDDLDGGKSYTAATSSDEESERQAPWVLGTTSWKAGNEHGLRGAGRHHDMHSRVPAAPPPCSTATKLPARRELGPAEEAADKKLSEEGLIDIDPEEGKKRGGELMAMLFGPQETSEAPSAAAVPRPTLSADAPVFMFPKPALPQQQARQPTRHLQAESQCWAATWEGCGTGGWSSEASTKPSPSTVNNGTENQWDWQQQRQGIGNNGTENQLCWEFATTGACPRGSRCRWEHDSQSNVNISYNDIVY